MLRKHFAAVERTPYARTMSAGIGKRLRDIRKRRGMSQRELANGSGVSLSLIRKLEQSVRPGPGVEAPAEIRPAAHGRQR